MNLTQWMYALILKLPSDIYWLTYFDHCGPNCSVLTPQGQNIFISVWTRICSIMNLLLRQFVLKYPEMECPYSGEPLLESTVWDEAIAVLPFCFAQLLKRLTRITVTMLCDIQWLSFLQISKIIVTQQLCGHFPKITGGQGQPGMNNRP